MNYETVVIIIFIATVLLWCWFVLTERKKRKIFYDYYLSKDEETFITLMKLTKKINKLKKRQTK